MWKTCLPICAHDEVEASAGCSKDGCRLAIETRSCTPSIIAPSTWSKSEHLFNLTLIYYLDRVKRIWYLSPMRATKVQASLRICAVSPEPSLLAHTSSESRGIFRRKARSLAPLNGWACAVEICHDGMLEDTNLLDGAHLTIIPLLETTLS